MHLNKYGIFVFCGWLALALSGCGAEDPSGMGDGTKNAGLSADKPRSMVVLFLGDSLTAGYGVAQDEAYPAILQQEWDRQNLPVEARNAGVSGSTTKGVLDTLNWTLTDDVDIVFVCIGANDGLRGLALEHSRRNLSAIVQAAQDRGKKVVLAGMKLPPNYSEQYIREFEAMYGDIAGQFHAPLLPFLLEGVAGHKELNQTDGIHPNAQGHRHIASTVLEFFERQNLLDDLQ